LSKANITTSGFSLAKRQELTGDDYYEIKQFNDLTIAVVCDGVGSAAEGALAAKKVTNHLITNFKNIPKAWSMEKAIKTFIKSINSILYAQSIQDYERAEIVTTVTICVIKGNRLYAANVGDTRIYLFRDNQLTQLSHDHNEEGMPSVLSEAIGISDDVEVFYFENNIHKNDRILMCSDGLYSLMSENMLSKYLVNGAYNIVKKASSLVEENLPDDTTAVVLEINEIDEIQKFKDLPLDIPEKLQKGDVIDGYKLTLSLIQNDRTWICEKNSKEYVIKFAPYEALENEEILDLYIKEVWNAKRLKAGFFPKSAVPKQRTARYYIMTKLEGITLKQYLKKRTLSIEESINLAKTLLSMSQYLTPSYLAPERFQEGAINEKTELYSIGVTLYESLTKKFPYGEIEPFQNPTFKDVNLPQKYNKNIPLWLESIILRATCVDQDLRYSNYSIMKFELDNPQKVLAFFNKNTPLLKRNPLIFYKIAFGISLLINFILFLND